jgi:hypothetical protein
MRPPQGEEASGALPTEAPPTHAGVEPFLVPDADDRAALRGQARAAARRATR